METITIERFKNAKAAVREVYANAIGPMEERVELYTMAVLDAIEAKVQEPPVMPDISEYKWEAERHHHGSDAFKVIAGGNGLVYHLSETDAKFMAGSKELAEKVLAMFETWSSGGHGKEALGMLDAMESMGCNMDKFRR